MRSIAAPVFGLVAVVSAIVAMPAAAQNSIRFRLDNAPSPAGSPTATGTTNNICVYAKHNGFSGGAVWHQIGCRALTTVGNHDFCLDSELIGNVYETLITIDGDNAFWLDKWEAWHTPCTNCSCTGSLEHSYGINNREGYCLSTDSSDYSGPECTAFGTEGQVGSGPSYSQLWWYFLH